VDNFGHALDTLLQLLIRIGNLIVAGIVAIELWLRAGLRQFGLPPAMQTAILVVLAVILIVGALRLFGGLIRVAVVIVVLIIAIHILLPVLQQR
jgi:hypothetical protein